MTEAEWLACSDVYALVGYLDLELHVSLRKIRLLNCACVAWAWHWGMSEPVPEAVFVCEAFADGCATAADLNRVANAMATLRQECDEPYRPFPRTCELTESLASPDNDGEFLLELCAYAADMYVNEEPEWLRIADFARDIFGNPFRPVTFAPEWRTSTAVALAQGIYDDRAFDRMPILADALQDAGCDADELLAHCRDPQQVHVRGCWVVDAVLGKS